MTETTINTTTNKSSSHHHNILKKNFTYSSSMDQQGITNQLNQNNENHATNCYDKPFNILSVSFSFYSSPKECGQQYCSPLL